LRGDLRFVNAMAWPPQVSFGDDHQNLAQQAAITKVGEFPGDPLEPPHAQAPIAVTLMIAIFESTINQSQLARVAVVSGR
jgi:hypothetical protein